MVHLNNSLQMEGVIALTNWYRLDRMVVAVVCFPKKDILRCDANYRQKVPIPVFLHIYRKRYYVK